MTLPAVMPSTWTPLAGLDPAPTWPIACQGGYRAPGCARPATWRRMWKTRTMPAPAFHYHCDRCRRSHQRHEGRVHPDLPAVLLLACALLGALVVVTR